jgi:hypothetical protein
MVKTKNPKNRQRYSIGETYGTGFESLTSAQRFEGAKLAKTEFETRKLVGASCPFQKKAKCIKKGGVCSIRLYQQPGDGPVAGVGPIITTCPQRFLESETICRWIGELLLGTKEPVILSQLGFLDRLRPEDGKSQAIGLN